MRLLLLASAIGFTLCGTPLAYADDDYPICVEGGDANHRISVRVEGKIYTIPAGGKILDADAPCPYKTDPRYRLIYPTR